MLDDMMGLSELSATEEEGAPRDKKGEGRNGLWDWEEIGEQTEESQV